MGVEIAIKFKAFMHYYDRLEHHLYNHVLDDHTNNYEKNKVLNR